MVRARGDGRKDDLNGSKGERTSLWEIGWKIDWGMTNRCALGWRHQSVSRAGGRGRYRDMEESRAEMTYCNGQHQQWRVQAFPLCEQHRAPGKPVLSS